MTIQEPSRRGVSRSEIARTLGVMEGAVRYHLRRLGNRAHRGGRADAPHRYRITNSFERAHQSP